MDQPQHVSNFELPVPGVTHGVVGNAAGLPVTPGMQGPSQPLAPGVPPAPPPMGAPAPAFDPAGIGVPVAQGGGPAPVSGQAPGNPEVAEDVDLIEKTWVLKAKEIVDRTQSDPYNLNKEISHLKADYLKKRYNKDLKLNES